MYPSLSLLSQSLFDDWLSIHVKAQLGCVQNIGSCFCGSSFSSGVSDVSLSQLAALFHMGWLSMLPWYLSCARGVPATV